MRIGLSVYGTMYGMGLHPKSTRPTIAPIQLMERARQLSLNGVEFPAQWLNDANVKNIKSFAEENNLYIVLDTAGYVADDLQLVLQLGARVGAETVRTVVGGAGFGGDRRPMRGRWPAFLQDIQNGLAEATKAAEHLGVNLAVENHQDLASEEILWLWETIASERFGINLDSGNPLATAEAPSTYFQSTNRAVKNVHLKDYTVHLSDEGYRLARCAIGQGVVPFPELFSMLSDNHPDMTMAIEMGALEARHTRLLADDFWPEYPARSARQLAEVIRFVRAFAKPTGDWRTPYERNESEEVIVAYEEHQLAVSIAYLTGCGIIPTAT